MAHSQRTNWRWNESHCWYGQHTDTKVTLLKVNMLSYHVVCHLCYFKHIDIWSGCRDGPSKDILLKKVQAAGFPSTSIEWISLDLSSMDSVSSFARTILNKNVPISILINNGMHTEHKRNLSCRYGLRFFLTFDCKSFSSWSYVCSI